jgi:uncharacterized protein (DUF1684 family)
VTSIAGTAVSELTLLDWKRRVFALYAEVRRGDPHRSWQRWRAERDLLFATHPQTPLPPAARAAFTPLPYYDYDPAARVTGRVLAAEPVDHQIDTSTGEQIRFRRFAEVQFELYGQRCSLPLYWLDGYGGGLFLPFADASCGITTYGGGRYLLDTVKGADLGGGDGELMLDFNYAYNPSCAYSPQWTCPLPPRMSRLDLAVEAGERMAHTVAGATDIGHGVDRPVPNP